MNRFNAEHYPDPTAAKALAAVAREEKLKARKPLAYICSPYSGDIEKNIEKARRFCRFAIDNNCIPLAPHLLFPQFMDDTNKEERELGIRFALILLDKCDEIWVFGDKVSEGMAREIAKAKKRGIPIRYFNNKCEKAQT